MPDRLRVAVWGLGKHALRRILPAVEACERTELAGVTSRDGYVRAAAASDHRCRDWADPGDMLASPDVDVVYLATPIGFHAVHGRRVLDSGKHLWCEKSMTDHLAATKQLVGKARTTGRTAFEAFMYRHHPQFVRLRDELASIGEVTSMTCRFTLPTLENPGFRVSREAGGGALLDVGCYPIDLAAAVLGDALDVVVARCITPAGSEVDMDGYAVLETPAGARAFLEWGYGFAYRNDVVVAGRGGTVYADRIFSKVAGLEPMVEIADARGDRRCVLVPAVDAFVAMLDAFARATTDRAAADVLHDAAIRQASRVESVLERSRQRP